MDPQEPQQSQLPAQPLPQPSVSPLPPAPQSMPAPNPVSFNPSGSPEPPMAMPNQPLAPGQQQPVNGESDKDYLVAWLLAFFLGSFGADRFYMGEIGLGVLKLVTLGGCGVWALVDWIIIMAGARKDKLGRPLANRQKNLKLSIIILIVSVAISIVLNIINAVVTLNSSKNNSSNNSTY